MTIPAYRESFVFLTDLAYKSRLTLPILVFCGFLLLNVRVRMELNVETEHFTTEELQNEMDLQNSDSESSYLSMGSDTDVSEEDLISLTDSEGSEFIRTIICLEVEIDQFRPSGRVH